MNGSWIVRNKTLEVIITKGSNSLVEGDLVRRMRYRDGSLELETNVPLFSKKNNSESKRSDGPVYIIISSNLNALKCA